MKNLLLIVSGFPFAKGEPFLKDEIWYLAKEFNKVFILTIKPPSAVQQYPTPENVVIIPQSKENKIVAVFKYLFTKKGKGFWKGFFYGIWKSIFPGYLIREIYLFMQGGAQINALKKYFESREEAPDIIYSYWFWAHAFLAIEARRRMFPNSTLVSRAHRYDVYNDYFWGDMPLKRWIGRNIDHIFCASEDAMVFLKKRYPEIEGKTTASYLGVNKQLTDKNNIKVQEVKEFQIVSCSHFGARKRVNHIMNALAAYKGDKKIRWTHLGGDNPKVEAQYREMANELLTPNNIDYTITGWLKHSDVIDFYKKNYPQIHLFINASSSEAVTYSIMEPMSFGIPAVAFDVGGNREIIDEKNGTLLAYTEDPEVLAREIERYAGMGLAELNTKRKAAFDTWKNKFDVEKNIGELISEIRKIESVRGRKI